MAAAESANVARFLPESARNVPANLAVRAPVGRACDPIRYTDLTFLELEDRSAAAAHGLRDRGIRRGMRVLLMVRPGIDLILIVFALFKIGAVPVVIDPGMGLRSFRACVRRTRPEALVGIALAQGVARLFRGDFASIEKRINPGSRSFRRASAGASGRPFPTADTGSDELAAILFTSGSTGPPKGVCYAHGMFEAQVRLIQQHYGIEAGEVDLPMLPIFALFNPALGMTTVVPQMNPSRPATVDPRRIVQAIRQCAVTSSFGSPVLWGKIGRHCRDQGITLPSVRRVLMAGAPVSPDIIRLVRAAIPHGEVHTPYGATECLPLSSISGSEILEETWERTEAGEGTCVGRLMPEIEAAILPITDEPISAMSPAVRLPRGDIGEIVVRGPVVTREYDRLPEATGAAKIADGDTTWHRMGDLGYRDESGRLWFCGRKVERVVGRERTWFTDPCEAIINRHPAVFRSALIGMGAPGEQEPVITVEPEPTHWPRSRADRIALADELRAWAHDHPATRAVTRILFKRRFPVDVRHNAKIHRLALAREMADLPHGSARR